MPTIDEKFDSRSATEGKSPNTELLYVVQGTNDDLEVKALLAATAPAFYDGLRRDTFSIETVGGGVWNCTVNYVLDTDESQYTFDTGGGTQHLSISLETMGRYEAPGEVAADFHSAIGVNQDKIEGVDVTIPVYNFTETHKIANGLVTGPYKAALFFLTGKVNDSAFRGFERGEVLFMGASGAKSGTENWEITYRFAASPNVQGLQLGDIQNIDKEGWNYLWCRFEDEEDAAAKILIKKPTAVYVERVYDYGDFTGLGLGS